MTSAQCVQGKMSVTLIAGGVNLNEAYQTLNVSKNEIIVHPGYNIDVNNIAMIQLKSGLKFGTKIGKIEQVNAAYKPKQADGVTIFGYINDQLRYINSTIHDFASCQQTHQQRKSDDPLLDEDLQFCINLSGGENNKLYEGGTNLLEFFFS